MRGHSIAGVAVTVLGLGLIAAPAATATPGGDHKQSVCHPVEGKGETGTGWNIIPPDKASSHIDEATGVGKHTRKDGRTDVYAVDGVCPVVVVPPPTTTTVTLPPVTETVTETAPPVTVTKTVTPTETATETAPPVTETTTLPGPTHTVTVPGPEEVVVVDGPPSTVTKSVAGPVSTVTQTGAPKSKSIVRDGKETLAYTGMDVGLVSLGVLLLGGGVFLTAVGRRFTRQH